MQPLLFKEIYKTKLWGGTDIDLFAQGAQSADNIGIDCLKGRDLRQDTGIDGRWGLKVCRDIGESYEISCIPGEETPVAEGPYAGKNLEEVIAICGATLVGEHNYARYGTTFPLLIKLISAAADLSIQVHPDDATARELGHPFGKNEMWYVVHAKADARVLAGFSSDFSAERYTEALAAGNLLEHVNAFPTHPGDCFYIPAGCIHSINAGNLLVEVQQNSNDTFRVYDYDRIGPDGRRRGIQVEEARRALRYEASTDHQVHYTPQNNRPVTLVSCPSFTTRLCRCDRLQTMDYRALDSFVIVIVFEGSATFTDAEGHSLRLTAGHTALFAADTTAVTVVPDARCAFLEVTLPE